MRHVSQVELETETIKILGAENRKNCNEITLKAACRACGINKVLLRLPDISFKENPYNSQLNLFASRRIFQLHYHRVKRILTPKLSQSIPLRLFRELKPGNAIR